MSDDKNLKNSQDRQRVSGDENYEVQYLTEQMNVTPSIVRDAIESVGNSREKVEEYIKNLKQQK